MRTELGHQGPQGQNPLDSARHMSHLPAVYLLNDNEDTQLSGILEDSCPWQRDQFSSWDLRRTCLSRACLVSLSNSKPMVTCHPSQACNQWLLGETRVPLIHFENGSQRSCVVEHGEADPQPFPADSALGFTGPAPSPTKP